MDEKQLLKIALFTSLIGLIILLIIEQKIDLTNSNISNITRDDIDDKVKIKGEITRITETPGLYIIDVKDFTGEIKVIVFKDQPLELKNGDIIEVEGTVALYKDFVEIIAKRIIVL
ncbi:MAG: OB-fold nucleic acid binding domain-containing protein [Nanoarchaeota archaeon]